MEFVYKIEAGSKDNNGGVSNPTRIMRINVVSNEKTAKFCPSPAATAKLITSHH